MPYLSLSLYTRSVTELVCDALTVPISVYQEWCVMPYLSLSLYTRSVTELVCDALTV